MYIKRHLEKEILKASKYYPVVMVSLFMVKTFFLIKLGTLTLYVWPVTRQLFFPSASPLDCAANRSEQVANLFLAARCRSWPWRWLVPTCGMSSCRSFSLWKSLGVPVAWLLARHSEFPAIQLWRKVHPLINRVS